MRKLRYFFSRQLSACVRLKEICKSLTFKKNYNTNCDGTVVLNVTSRGSSAHKTMTPALQWKEVRQKRRRIYESHVIFLKCYLFGWKGLICNCGWEGQRSKNKHKTTHRSMWCGIFWKRFVNCSFSKWQFLMFEFVDGTFLHVFFKTCMNVTYVFIMIPDFFKC